MATNEYPILTIGTSLNGTDITFVSGNHTVYTKKISQCTGEYSADPTPYLKECMTYREYQDTKRAEKTKNTKQGMLNKIEKVIFNNPATIVIWENGDKTVVKCDCEKYDPEKGLAMAITKYLLGNNQGYYYDIFTKWLPKKKQSKKKKISNTARGI